MHAVEQNSSSWDISDVHVRQKWVSSSGAWGNGIQYSGSSMYPMRSLGTEAHSLISLWNLETHISPAELLT